MSSHTAHEALFAAIEAFENKWLAADVPGEQTRKALLKSKSLKYFHKLKGMPVSCKLVRDYDAINSMSRYFGLFSSVSTMQCDAQMAIESYHNRDAIKNCFKSGKSDIGMKTERSHTDATMNGSFLVSFCAMMILCELRRPHGAAVYRDG